MKQLTLLLLIIIPFISKAQSKKDSTISLPISKDTVDISKVKFIKFSKGIIPTSLLDKTEYYLSKQDIDQLIAIIGTLTYNESHSAIEKLKMVFGLAEPKKQ
jgi:hypothetical protein